jgi:HD-GYP domain-containing protein (c-di-GMP phosphodiesterase class II)
VVGTRARSRDRRDLRRLSCCGYRARTTCGRRSSTTNRHRGGCSVLDEALAGFGDAADLKSPWFTGHSRGVTRLARAAAERLMPADAALVYRAGLLHDLGRVAVPTGIWERPEPLRPDEWELVHLHPYHTGRILARSPVLARLGQIACRHHERKPAVRVVSPVSGGGEGLAGAVPGRLICHRYQ